jgi:hypothetical protein
MKWASNEDTGRWPTPKYLPLSIIKRRARWIPNAQRFNSLNEEAF